MSLPEQTGERNRTRASATWSSRRETWSQLAIIGRGLQGAMDLVDRYHPLFRRSGFQLVRPATWIDQMSWLM